MNKEGKFGTFEMVTLATPGLCAKILYTSTSSAVKEVGTFAWFMTIISCITAIIFFDLTCVLLSRFPGEDIFSVYERVWGKFIGKLVAILYSAFLVFYCASNSREFLEMIKSYNLPDTPSSIIIGSLIAVSALICYKGIENISRLSYIIFYLLLIGTSIILALAIPYYNFNYIKPYLGYGLGKTVYIGFLRSSAYQEVMTLAVIVKSSHNLKDLRKAGLISLIITGVFFSITMFLYVSAFGYMLAGENVSGIFQLSTTIYYNRYFQRIEAIFLFIWVLVSIINTSLSLYMAVTIYCKGFNIKEHTRLILPFCFLVYMGSLIPNNFSEVIDINMRIIRQYSFGMPLVFPALTLLISIILKKKAEKNNV
ncbi:GerAB/ArcD/ProY family transporter [Clostridium hydrogenum]|uniref:GerAB/ArcD/ProY family transporter n=1 Tax=Clostridium hydrogenum TaxID=2855764 RepID=UPI001F47960D|nr:endospore germination permease [Clostridium hydrogenum]